MTSYRPRVLQLWILNCKFVAAIFASDASCALLAVWRPGSLSHWSGIASPPVWHSIACLKTAPMILGALLFAARQAVCCCGLERSKISAFLPASAALWPGCQGESVSLTSRRHSASQHAVTLKDVGGGAHAQKATNSHAAIDLCMPLRSWKKVMNWRYFLYAHMNMSILF